MVPSRNDEQHGYTLFFFVFKYIYTGEPCQHVSSGSKWDLFSCIDFNMNDKDIKKIFTLHTIYI